ncbi:MAG TPA: hypothetical protein VML01_04290 [Bryobacterales bacterium]|nr:hypothetical protein [Bryobacterales bacterium]
MGLIGNGWNRRFTRGLITAPALALMLAAWPSQGLAEISETERALLIREMMSEHGTAKIVIPRSKKPLALRPDGAHDEEQWEDALDEYGPAARVGDTVEITKVEFKGSKLIIELNHGLKGGRKWWHRVQVAGASNQGTTLGSTAEVYAPGGTKIALVYDKELPSMEADELRDLLKPVLDFEQRSATELYIEQLPEEFQVAIKEKTVLEDMDRDMVLLSKGRPDRKVRDFKDGVETEDWIYGIPPGDVTFVTFEDGKVIRVKESYAAVGGQVKQDEDPNQPK